MANVCEQFFSTLGLEAPSDAWEVREHQPLFLNALDAVANKCGILMSSYFLRLKLGSTGMCLHLKLVLMLVRRALASAAFSHSVRSSALLQE